LPFPSADFQLESADSFFEKSMPTFLGVKTMESYALSWEDEENNRVVAFSVEYRVQEDQLQIGEITPTSVSFVDAVGSSVRQISVWTDKGRELLARQYQQAVGPNHVRNLIEESLLTSAR
jgi:hypothetical protein